MIRVRLEFSSPGGTGLAQTISVPDGNQVTMDLPAGATQVTVFAESGPVPAVEPAELADGFRGRVLSWLRDQGGVPAAVSVQDVVAYGTDWAGDTAGGFYSEFDLTIDYTDESGRPGSKGIAAEGDEVASLWQWVVSGWPGQERADA